MTWFARSLTQLDPRDTVAEPADVLVAWLTGQSSWRQAQLSPAQEALLTALQPLGCAAVRAGLPWNRAFSREPWSPTPLLAASLRNAVEFAEAVVSHRFASSIAIHLQPLADAARRHLVLLCGSCGMQMLAAALPALRLPPDLTILALALGPTSLSVPRHPQLRLLTARGRGDLVSRALWHGRVEYVPALGHLDYAEDPGVRQWVFAMVAAHLQMARP